MVRSIKIMERKPLWEEKPEEIKQQDILTQQQALGHKALDMAILHNCQCSPETLDYLLAENPDWIRSADGHWHINPIKHIAEYED